MPVRRVGKGCYQWGHHGKVYCGPGARAKAERQGRAAYAHGYRGREMRDDGFSTITLWRAADDDYIPDGASFARRRSTAEAYLDNPNFGGERLFRADVIVDDAAVLNLYEESDPVSLLADRYDLQHPGAIGIEEWIPRSTRLQEILQKDGYDWVIVEESFPEGAETWIWVGPFEREPVLEPFG